MAGRVAQGVGPELKPKYPTPKKKKKKKRSPISRPATRVQTEKSRPEGALLPTLGKSVDGQAGLLGVPACLGMASGHTRHSTVGALTASCAPSKHRSEPADKFPSLPQGTTAKHTEAISGGI
jgi:hypothetical protein